MFIIYNYALIQNISQKFQNDENETTRTTTHTLHHTTLQNTTLQ